MSHQLLFVNFLSTLSPSITIITTLTLSFIIRARYRKYTKILHKQQSKRDELLQQHEQYFTLNIQTLAHGIENALVIIRGEGSYLFDDLEHKYLDSRNNVAILGHSPPDFVEKISRQLTLTNTNTRYLHPARMAFVQELSKTLPSHLCKFFLVNSGSEANELALRMAYAVYHHKNTVKTKKQIFLAMELGYHGFTTGALSVSPYKFLNRNNNNHHHHQQYDEDSIHASKKTCVIPSLHSFQQLLSQQLEKQEEQDIVGLIIEPALSVAGVIIPPPEWLQDAFQTIHKRGGVIISDEIQIGCGRLGDYFWGFEMVGKDGGELPDIITIGKGIANGISLGVVVCTQEIASILQQEGREIFSTFGGNPVACVAGLHVLQQIHTLQLQQHSKKVGYELKSRLEQLQRKSTNVIIKQIRGMGLFIGIEFISREIAKMISLRMLKKHSILTSCDGSHDQVMVIKPPLCWTIEVEVDWFVQSMIECVSFVIATSTTIIKSDGSNNKNSS
jgi:4-aminobutyrate aminotransferase-like enzyme